MSDKIDIAKELGNMVNALGGFVKTIEKIQAESDKKESSDTEHDECCRQSHEPSRPKNKEEAHQNLKKIAEASRKKLKYMELMEKNFPDNTKNDPYFKKAKSELIDLIDLINVAEDLIK